MLSLLFGFLGWGFWAGGNEATKHVASQVQQLLSGNVQGCWFSFLSLV